MRSFFIRYLLFFRRDYRFTAHIGTKYFGNVHAAVRLQMVLHKRNQHTGRSNYGIVERMR